MSYGLPPEPRKRRATGGGGLVFLIVLALGAFFIFRGGFNGGQPPGQDGGALDPFEATGQSDRTEPTSRQRAESGDWEMEDVAIDKRKSNSGRRTTGDSDKTTSGDWALEELPASQDKRDSGFKFSDQTAPGPPKSTEKGDWKLEEVPDKKDQ